MPLRMRFPPILLLACALAATCHSSSSKAPPVSNAFTLHYHRALGDYAGWTTQIVAGAVETTATAAAPDGFGAVFPLTVKDGATTLQLTLQKAGSADAAGTLSVDASGSVREAWVFSGFAGAFIHRPPAIPGPGQVAVYYSRNDGSYSAWGLHTWGDVVRETAWQAPLQPVGIDPDLGAGFLVDVKPGGDRVNVIAHSGDTKDPGPDMGWNISQLGNIVFLTSGSAVLTALPHKAGAVSIANMAAHLVRTDTVAWNIAEPSAVTFELRTSSTASISQTDLSGGSSIALTPNAAGLDTGTLTKAPYLAGFRAFSIAAGEAAKVKEALKGQLIAVALDAAGKPVKATQVQTALALDDLYAYDGPLGITFAAGVPTVYLWAPTAQSVKLHLHDATKTEILPAVTLSAGPQGEWSATGAADWVGKYYVYEIALYHPVTSHIEHVMVTDPYAVNLSTNGLFAQIVDLADPALKPAGWDTLVKRSFTAPEDIVVYESHIRDFSATDQTVPAPRQGKYLAFVTDSGAVRSDGLNHLAALSAAGLSHVHLLPAFDLATVDEDPANRVDLTDSFDRLCQKSSAVPTATCALHAGKTIAQVMTSLDGASDQQQLIASYMQGLDAFNWGYDPFHYGAPEGSYASTADGPAKILEFRQMVQGLAAIDLRVVLDVVYNHTNASGVGPKSVLDQIVPGYYHRLDPETGYVLSSSCCSNTATEHRMMQRLMVDTLVRWARDYKIDGFRFDLMGLHLKQNILDAKAALAALTPGADGVDGSTIYLYGEGWDVGEMASNRRGMNATQLNMGGTGIGTFNDRLRDGARGGGPFDNGTDLRKNQGFTSGLFTDPNELNSGAQAEKDKLLIATDLIKIGMAGGLEGFRLINSTSGTALPAGAIGYGTGAPAGYTKDPQESINYVSAHDNQVLWDIVQYKLPRGRSTADRVRAITLALDLVALGQGVPFFHMGDDLLRSKSMERDSYDSGDWFNRVDWSEQGNGWKSGLPNAGKDQGNWPVITPIFADVPTPASTDIQAAAAHFQEMLKIRFSSPLFRLRTAAEIEKRVDFQNTGPGQVPGLIVMTITDDPACVGADLDPARLGLVVVVNADKQERTVTVNGAASLAFTLHTIQQASADPLVKGATATGDQFKVPARTTAVFEQLTNTGTGLPCNGR